MKRFYVAIATVCLAIAGFAHPICSGNAGPNLLGAKGTFSAPFITVNNRADNRLRSDSSTFNLCVWPMLQQAQTMERLFGFTADSKQ